MGDRSRSPRSPSALPPRAAGQERAADCSTALWAREEEGRAAGTAPSGPPASAAGNATTGASSSRNGVIQAGSAALPLKTRCGAQNLEPSVTCCPRSTPAAARRAVKGSDPALLRTPGAVAPLPGFHTTLFARPDTTYWSGRSLAYTSVRPARCRLLRAWITLLT